ncbi:helix-turn-helix domain-containing protein [Halococcoides cellulosivorans]|uniref:Transcriptional regulator n=1 Tax=Halococcoides cellulosivorans TaxID=1679096 RepID=A0A2R4X0V1_9EURY|nr:helix-turn-helix domain-containing protein [Halococcoides cellulosivorans]AWB27405.1 transcriptional regulator [Halococcoides cellulosivorans]
MDGDADRLAERIAGEIALSDDPGGTLRKWRTDFEISQTDLAAELDVSPSVISDYEGGRRDPGIGVVRRTVAALIAIDRERGGRHVRRSARVRSAGFDRAIVHDLREYAARMRTETYFDRLGVTPVTDPSGGVAGHTVIDSIEAITRLSSEEFYRLYGRSTTRAMIFTNVTRGESPLVAIRVVSPTPDAVILHGIDSDEVWEHAADLARIDGYALGVSDAPLEEFLDRLAEIE